jgi:putative hydrolase of the HAD superfamily
VVSFDAGGVLLFPDWRRLSRVLARCGHHVPPERLAAADPHAKYALDHPAGVSATNNAGHGQRYFLNLLAAAGLPAAAATAAVVETIRDEHARQNLWSELAPGAPECLQGLRAQGCRLIVVSNSDGRLASLIDSTGLAPWFELVVDSHNVGVEKPDPAIFRLALGRLDATGADAWHVGDLYQIDVVGARAAGLTPVLLDPLELYPDADCASVRSLQELPALVG